MFETTRKRKLGNNTFLVKTDRGFGIKLHQTVVVEYLPTETIINSGGWQTVTTKQRINNFGPVNCYVFQKDFTWFVAIPGEDILFFDRMSFPIV